jgi:hypothetical protein
MGEGQRPIFRGNAASILRRHSLQRGLQGYLILFDHRTLVLDWQVESRSVLSPLVVLRRVKAFHRSPGSTLSTETTSVITLTFTGAPSLYDEGGQGKPRHPKPAQFVRRGSVKGQNSSCMGQ